VLFCYFNFLIARYILRYADSILCPTYITSSANDSHVNVVYWPRRSSPEFARCNLLNFARVKSYTVTLVYSALKKARVVVCTQTIVEMFIRNKYTMCEYVLVSTTLTIL